MGSSSRRNTTYRLDPLVPAELELLPIDVAVLVLVEHGKHLLQPIRRHHVDVTFIIAEQCPTDQRKLVQRKPIISAEKRKGEM